MLSQRSHRAPSVRRRGVKRPLKRVSSGGRARAARRRARGRRPRCRARASASRRPARRRRRRGRARRAARASRSPTPRRPSCRPGRRTSSSNVRSMSTEKSPRSRLLMPITSASTLERDLELLLVVDLDEHVEVERARLAVQLARASSGSQRGDDQQDRVGARGRRLVELVGVDDEVLAQHGQVRRRARGAQVVERAAEVERLGEDGQRGGAAALVGRARPPSTSAPSRIAPADGERRLCSAITRDARAASAPPGTGAALRARRAARPRAAASGHVSRRRSTSSRVASTMRSSTLTSAPAYP